MGNLFGLYRFELYSYISFASALMALCLAIVLWRSHMASGGRYLAYIEIMVVWWTFTFGMEASATTVALKTFWAQAAYLSITTCPVLYFIFAMAYSGHHALITRRNILLLSIIPLITLLLVITNASHGLIWMEITIPPQTNIATYRHGLWFWLFIAYVYILLFAGLFSIYLTVLKFPPFFKKQIVVLLIGSALPMVSDLSYLFHAPLWADYDLTPIMFVLGGGFLGLGMFKFHMFDLAPIARNILIDTMTDGVLVLNFFGQIIDLNPAMETLTGRGAIGRPAKTVFAHWPDFVATLAAPNPTAIYELPGPDATAKIKYELQWIPLSSGADTTGALVIIRNITTRKQLEAERETLIRELQEALAEVKKLGGLLPICANCKKIRDDKGYWQDVAVYIRDHANVEFSHGICPDCMAELYPEYHKKLTPPAEPSSAGPDVRHP